MQRNFPRALSAVLKHEGGYVDHPKDPGGATNKGITIATFRKWVKRDGTKADLRNIADADVAKVYRKHYWDKVRADDLPDGLDYAVFDYAVNSGPRRAVKHLQEVLGVAQDGIVGHVTLAAAHKAGPAAIAALCDRRMRFLRSLGTWDTFGRGWSNRVDGVRLLAALLATETAPQRPTTPSSAPSSPTRPPNARPAPPQGRGKAGWIVALIIAAAGVLTGLWPWLSSLIERIVP